MVRPSPELTRTPEGSDAGWHGAASCEIRLWADPRKSVLLFCIENGRVYHKGEMVLYFNDERIWRGANPAGEILFTIAGERIFSGANAAGELVYTVKDNRVLRGNEKGPVIYTIRGQRLFKGSNTAGDIVFQANANLEGHIQFLLPILPILATFQ
jgi:hypothetical protein